MYQKGENNSVKPGPQNQENRRIILEKCMSEDENKNYLTLSRLLSEEGDFVINIVTSKI